MKSSRFVLYAGVVAAVLVAALIVGFGLRDRNSQVAGPVAATSTPTPASSPPATPSPIATSPTTGQVAPCRSDQLSGTYEFNGAAAGSAGASFRLAVAAGSCEVPNGPPVRFLDANGALVLSATSPASSGPMQTLRSGTVGKDSGFLVFQWSLHGTEPGYRCAVTGPQVASVAVDLGRTGLAATDALRLDIPAAQRFSFCADPPERVSASIIGSRQP